MLKAFWSGVGMGEWKHTKFPLNSIGLSFSLKEDNEE